MATTKLTSINTSAAPRDINPLVYGDELSECAQSVGNVLAFMADALRKGPYLDNGADEKRVSDGAALILETCVAALDFHAKRKGGAA